MMSVNVENKYESAGIPVNSQQGRLALANGYPFLNLFRYWMMRVVLGAGVVQLIFFFSAENLFAVISAILGWKLTETYILKPVYLLKYTISSLIILGFSLTQFCMPLIFTLVEGKPLIYNLDLPYQVFTHSLLAIMTLLLAHALYRHLVPMKNVLRVRLQSTLARLSFYKAPTSTQAWIMGFIGILSMAATYFGGNRYGVSDEDRGTAAKIFQGLTVFAYTPFFLLLQPLYARNVRFRKVKIWKILLFLALIILLGIGGNTRGVFMIALTTSAIAYFFGLLIGKFDYKIFKLKNILAALIGFWILTGPLSDLGTAMVVVRSQRSDISGAELLSKTLDVYQDKEALRFYKHAALDATSDWDEHYFDNIFLARFCNLKYNDEGLKQTKRIGRVDNKMRKYTLDKFWAMLPQPVLDGLGVGINKDQLISSSFGDYLFQRAGGTNALGGFRTGQFASTGMTAFGWWYLLILFVGIIPMFFLFDIFVLYFRGESGRGVNYISMAALMLLNTFFMFLSLSSTSESVIMIYNYMLRGWIQLAITYWLIFLISRKLSFFFRPRTSAR